jgi:hypothetical protein
VDSTLTADVTFDYAAICANTGKVTVTIKNTTESKGAITGFAFNLPDGVNSLFGAYLMPANWDPMLDRDAIGSPQPFGMFDIAALTGSNLNGGSVNDGIGMGETFKFEFGLSGLGMDSLDEDSFLELLSDATKENVAAVPFLVRFQGTTDGGSDVGVPGGETQGSEVPEPGTWALIGAAASTGWVARRRKVQPSTTR